MKESLSVFIQAEQRVWAGPDSLKFFQDHRREARDLYLSERLFLPEVVPLVSSCLDIGCAAGGFSRILKTYNPTLQYTGLDINEEFVALARREFPDSRFEVGDGVHFGTPPGSFDLVFSSGVLHLNSRFREIVRAGYEQARRFLLCDFRLTRGSTMIGSFKLDFKGRGNQPAELPYILLNVDELVRELTGLRPTPKRLVLRGYPHPVSPMASGVPAEAFMTFVLIEKGPTGAAGTQVHMDLRDQAAWDREVSRKG